MPPLAALCGWICDVNLKLMEQVIETALRLPCSHIWGPAPPAWWIVLFYTSSGIGLAVARLRPPRRWQFALLDHAYQRTFHMPPPVHEPQCCIDFQSERLSSILAMPLRALWPSSKACLTFVTSLTVSAMAITSGGA